MSKKLINVLIVIVLGTAWFSSSGTEIAAAQTNDKTNTLQITSLFQATQRMPTFATPTDIQPSAQSSARIAPVSTPQDLAYAMGIRASDLVSASLNGSDARGTGIGTNSLGASFPTEGGTFAILSSGLAESADDPNDDGSLSFELDGLNNSQGNDVTQLALQLHVPTNMNCASIDFAYYSEEFPEFVGSEFNDAFTAELGGTNLIIVNDQVVAPLNFAFDTQGNVISVNTVFGVTLNSGTTYDGATNLLRAHTPVSPGSTVDIVLSVQDLGDSIYDSAVFLDKFFWSNDPQCNPSAQQDSDGDGLLDTWETQGLTVQVDGTDVFVDLPAMGADPNKKDIFVEIDYMVDQGTCLPVVGCVLGHSHLPKPNSIPQIVTAFLNSPVDGSAGINVHVDYGPDSVMNPVTGQTWGTLSQSNSLPHEASLGSKLPNDDYDWTEFDQIKQANFSKARAAVFHYAVFAHNLGGFGSTSGVARGVPGSDFIISLGSYMGGGSPNEQAGTFMHELGHNLGLCHGGERDAPAYEQCNMNFKPNYLSVMNYSFQTRGLRINGQDGHFDYSRFLLPPLNENNLNETIGLNGGAEVVNFGTRYFCRILGITVPRAINSVNDPIDWNCNFNTNDVNVSVNLNEGWPPEDTQFTELKSYDDWANLVFTGGAIGQPGAELDLPSATPVEEISQEEDAQLPSPYKVGVSASGNSVVPPGSSIEQTITVANLGDDDDVYSLTTTSSQGWADLSGIPVTLSLAAGTSIDLSIPITVPASANVDEKDVLTFSAQSQANPLMKDVAFTQTSVVGANVLDILRAATDPTRAVNVDFTVTFFVPVTGVNTSDFSLHTTGVMGASITGVSGSDTTYTVTVNTGSGDGTIRLDVVDNNSIIDAGGNPLGGVNAGDGNFTSGEVYTIIKQPIASPWIGGLSITSDQNVVAVGRPHVGSEVASYGGFTSGSLTTYVPMLFKTAFGSYNAALYVQNVHASNTANITIKYYDSNGVLNCTKADTIAPVSSKGYWIPTDTCDTGSLPAGWVGGVVVTSDQPIVAVGRPHVGSEVMTYDGFASGSLNTSLPMLFKGAFDGSYNAAFYLQNTHAGNTASVTIKYYDSNGVLNCTKADTIAPLASKGYWVPSVTCDTGSLPSGWVGGVVVTSNQAIVAVGRPHIGSQVTTYNGFPAGSLSSYVPMLFKSAFGSYDSAFYLQNIHASNTATITIKYYDSNGVLNCTKADTIAPLASKGYWLPAATCDSGSLPSGWVGGAVVTSDQPIVAVGRPHLGTQVTTYNGFTGGSHNAYVPMLFKGAFGGSYNAAFYIQNTEASTANITIKFYDTSGNLSCTRTDTIAALSTLGYWVPGVICDP